MGLGAVGAAAAVGSVAEGAYGLFSNSGVPSAPQLPYFGQANSDFGSGLNGLNSTANQGNQYTQAILNNPYASGYQGAAGQAAGQYGVLGQDAMQASGALYGAGNTALGAGNAILQAGFDPQNQLYARVQNQNSQQNLAQLANMGVGGTPFGAGVAGQENSNFNMDWQNNLLSREATAAGAFSGLNNTAQNDFAAGGQQGQLGAQSALMAGQLPYSTYNSINQNDVGALMQQQGLYQGVTGAANQYLGQGISNYANQANAFQQQYGVNQNNMNSLGQGLGYLGNYGQQQGWWGGGGSGGDVWAGAGATGEGW